MKGGGGTLRDHLVKVYEMTGKLPKELADTPDLPPPIQYIWDWYERISMGRTGSGFGANPLSWPDIEAWQRLHGVTMEPWEVELIKTIDLAFLIAQAKDK